MLEGLKDGNLVLSNNPALHEEVEQLRSGVVNATENLLDLENRLNELIENGNIIDANLYGRAIYDNLKLMKGKELESLGLDADMADMIDGLGTDDTTEKWENAVEGLNDLLVKELFLKGELKQVVEYYLLKIQKLLQTDYDERDLYRDKQILVNFVGYYISKAYFDEKDFEKVKLGLEKYEYIMEQFHQLNIVEEDDELELKISKPNKA